MLAALVAISSFAGCSAREGSSDESSGSSTSSSTSSKKEKDKAKEGTVGSITPDFREDVAEKKELNEDTVGWLFVSGTQIEDVVVMGKDNQFYRRRNFEKKEEFDGVYYADRRSEFGNGTRKDLGVNTCIYGHAFTDNEESARYQDKFGPLHDLRNPEYAKEMPYIFFSTAEENMAFEIMAVCTLNADNPAVPYNYNNPDQKAFVKMVKEEILPRSKYNYNVEIKDTDKFITLSTCIYITDTGYDTNYPNTYIRYMVMGKLVDPKEKLKEQADFTINESVIYDQDGPIGSKK